MYIRWAADRLNVADPAFKRTRSGDNSTVFEITAGNARWFLKAQLTAAGPGTSIARLAKSLPPATTVELPASALRACHSATAENAPFEAYIPGESSSEATRACRAPRRGPARDQVRHPIRLVQAGGDRQPGAVRQPGGVRHTVPSFTTRTRQDRKSGDRG
jgi:hypothetical protein